MINSSDFFISAATAKPRPPHKVGHAGKPTLSIGYPNMSNCGNTAIITGLFSNEILVLGFALLTFRDGILSKNVIFRWPPRHEASTTDAETDRVGRVEQPDARAGNSAPKGGPQLEFFRRQLKTWSKSEPSVALVQGPTYLCLHLAEGLRRNLFCA